MDKRYSTLNASFRVGVTRRSRSWACEQAARAGMFLRARGIEPDHAYTSTLHRTEQTIASLSPGLAYERLDGLREWYFG